MEIYGLFSPDLIPSVREQGFNYLAKLEMALVYIMPTTMNNAG
jgi:hypothetical protein